MHSPVKRIRDKQQYCSKLINKAPKSYETYQRMLKTQRCSYSSLNTCQASIEITNRPVDNNGYKKNYCTKYDHINSGCYTKLNKINQKRLCDQRISYIGFLKKNGFSFTNEKRFKWQNLRETSYPTGINYFPRHTKIKREKSVDYCQKESEIKRHKKLEPNAGKNIDFNQTKRVILSEYTGKEADYLSTRHKKYPQLNKFLNLGEGGISYLLKKAPLKYNYKGIKIVKRCQSYDLNLFTKHYAKIQIPKHKKVFVVKDHIKEFLKKELSKEKKRIQSKSCIKFKNRLYINPINWSINKYNNLFYG